MEIIFYVFAVIGMVYTSVCIGEIIYGVCLAFKEEEPKTKTNAHKMKIWARTAEIVLRIQLLYHEISLDREIKKLEKARKELDEMKEERDQWLKELDPKYKRKKEREEELRWINHKS